MTYYEYDTKGNLTKTIYPDTSTEISVYDTNNQVTQFTDRDGLVTKNTYNTDGLLTQTVRGGSQTTEYSYYDEETYGIIGLVQTETDPHENTTSYTYDEKGNVLTTTQSIGSANRITTNTYDDEGRLIQTVDPNGICTEYLYNAAGQVLITSVKDKNNANVQVSRTVYDVLGQVIQEISPLDYNANKDNVDSGKYSDATVGTRTEYNAKGQVIKETDPMGNVTSYAYDNDGNLQQETLANGSYRTYDYDKDGRKTSESFYDHATGTTTKLQDISYTESRNETKTTDYLANGLTAETIEEYNWEGKLVKRTSPNKSVQTNTYEKGLLMKETYALGSWVAYTYDAWGRTSTQTSSFDASGDSKTTYTYDKYGNVLSESVKNNAAGQPETYTKKEYVYDSQDNQVTTILYEGSTPVRYIQSYYSWDGKLLREYKGLTKLLTITGLDQVQNPDNQDYSVIKYDYDTMGRLEKKTDALNQTETYEYDKENRQVSMTDRNGTKHIKTYDRNNQTTQTVSGSITKKFIYDRMGNLTSEKEGSIETVYTYDGRGSCLGETTDNVVKTYTYNHAGMVTGYKITVGGTQKQNVTNTYDTMGNLTAVYESGTLKASYTYDESGRLLKTTNANGTTEENTYNLAGLVTSTVNKKGTAILSTYDYTYTYDGKQRTKTDSTGTITYTYDGQGQLIKATDGSSGSDNTTLANAAPIAIETPTNVTVSTAGLIRYYKFTPATTGTYVIASTDKTGDPYGCLYSSTGTQLAYNDDGNGNLNFKIEYTLTAGTPYVIGAKVYSSTSIGQYMLTITPPPGSLGVREYTYDASGNRTKLKETKNGSVTETTYTYDKNDRLLTEKTGAQTVTYSYDSNGNLIKKSDGTEQTFDALNRMTSYKSAAGTTTAYTYYPNDMRRSKGSTTQVWIGDEIALDLNGSTTVSSYIHGQKLIQSGYGWYLYNAHGDVTALTNASGSITRNYDYDPYGVQYSSVDSADSNPYRYCGEYYDKESGYTYLRVRYYDPAIGRFVSEDSALDGWNWYVYCGNNPIMYIDPSGNCYVDKKTNAGTYIGTYWVQASVPGVPNFCNKCKKYQPSATGSSDQKRDYIYRYLRKYFGVDHLQSCAILGNICVETWYTFSPLTLQGNKIENSSYVKNFNAKDGKGWGILQWSYPTRKQALYDYAKIQNKQLPPVGDLTIQLEFFKKETKGTYSSAWNKFKKNKTLEGMVKSFCNDFEQAGKPHTKDRVDAAKKYDKMYKNLAWSYR